MAERPEQPVMPPGCFQAHGIIQNIHNTSTDRRVLLRASGITTATPFMHEVDERFKSYVVCDSVVYLLFNTFDELVLLMDMAAHARQPG